MSNEHNEHDALNDTIQLEKSLKDDACGEHLKELLAYFDEAVEQAQAHALGQTQLTEERQMAGQLVDGFRAAQSILSQVWASFHEPSAR